MGAPTTSSGFGGNAAAVVTGTTLGAAARAAKPRGHSGHVLKGPKGPLPSWSCDGCGCDGGDMTPRDAARWECRECNFDYCGACYTAAASELSERLATANDLPTRLASRQLRSLGVLGSLIAAEASTAAEPGGEATDATTDAAVSLPAPATQQTRRPLQTVLALREKRVARRVARVLLKELVS